MGNSEAVKRYQQTHDVFKIRPTLEEGQQIRDYARERGMSVQGLFFSAVREYMAAHKDGPQSAQGGPTGETV